MNAENKFLYSGVSHMNVCGLGSLHESYHNHNRDKIDGRRLLCRGGL